MNKAWIVELTRILVLLVSALLLGFTTELWLFSVVLHSCIYIAWNIYQLWIFERWLKKGAPVKSAPDTSGIWALIVQHFHQSKKLNKSRKKQLANIASNYQSMMSALPDATIVLNDKLEIEWANKPSREILGIDVKKDIGQPIDNIVKALGLEVLLFSDDKKSEIEMQSPVDTIKTLNLSRLQYGNNKTLLIARDVSQRIAIQKLRKAFIANASHELRTPLTVISGYLEILDSDDDLPPSISTVINNALQQALRMEKILSNLLILSKLEEKGYSKSRGKVIDVPEILKRIVADFKDANSPSHEFELKIDANLKLKIKEQEFYSLCQNLLSNAIKYSAPGSLIKVCWLINEDNFACLSVYDQGEGIAEEHLTRLTERFYRANVERDRKIIGTGLGLSIVKHILDNAGGYLEIKSELQEGSIFTACFPKFRISYDNNG